MGNRTKLRRLTVFFLLIVSFSLSGYAAGVKKASEVRPPVADTLQQSSIDSTSPRKVSVLSHASVESSDDDATAEKELPTVAESFEPASISWVYTSDGILMHNLPEGASLSLLNLHGKKVLTMDDVEETAELTFSERGIFILQIHYDDKMIAYRIRI